MLSHKILPLIPSDAATDRERQVILEWRVVWEGEPYERHFFTQFAFDVPIDETLFSPESRGPPMA